MGAAERQPYRRKHWVVAPRYQWKVTGIMATCLTLIVLATLCLVYFALWSTLHDLELGQEAVFVTLFLAVAWMVTAELMIMIPLVIVVGILLTHKFVGPIGRIKAALDRMAQGHFDLRLTLRRGDVLTEMAESINRLAASLKGRQP